MARLVGGGGRGFGGGDDINPSSYYSFKADIWSFAMIFYELLTLQLPYSDMPPQDAMEEREKGHPPPLPPRAAVPLPFDVSGDEEEKGIGEEEKMYRVLVSIYRQLAISNPSQRPDASRTRLLIEEGIQKMY